MALPTSITDYFSIVEGVYRVSWYVGFTSKVSMTWFWNKEFNFTSPWYYLSSTENVKSSVQTDKIGAEKVCVLIFLVFKVLLVSSILIDVHEIHVLNPTFVSSNYKMPYTTEQMKCHQDVEKHFCHLKVYLDILRCIRLSDCWCNFLPIFLY